MELFVRIVIKYKYDTIIQLNIFLSVQINYFSKYLIFPYIFLDHFHSDKSDGFEETKRDNLNLINLGTVENDYNLCFMTAYFSITSYKYTN